MTSITEDNNIFLGSYNDINSLMLNNVFYINCTKDFPSISKNSIRIPIDDNGEDTLIEYFENICKLIDIHLMWNRNIAIYCEFGQQRSAAVTAAFLIYKYKLTVD
jgi:protein-tyrosine phosphatase